MSGVSGFMRVVVSFGWLALVGGSAWMGYQYLNQDRARDELLVEHRRALEEKDRLLAEHATQIGDLEDDLDVKQAELEESQEEVEHLDLSLKLMKVSKRVAQLAILDKTEDPETGVVVTKVKFMEVDAEGVPIGGSRTFELQGDLVYIDAWVVKFDDALVEEADPLRSTSMCVFRRIFGEHTKPADGVPLDKDGARPLAYGGGEPESEFESEIWSNFWELANDPTRAEELGIRAIHGEAPSMKVQKGKIYRLSVRASGGLDFTPIDVPAVLAD